MGGGFDRRDNGVLAPGSANSTTSGPPGIPGKRSLTEMLPLIPPSASASPAVAPIQLRAAGSAQDPRFDEDGGPSSNRFHGDADLGAVESSWKTLKVGDTGPAVRKVQQALFDLEYRPIDVTGTYDYGTADQVKRYQQKLGVGGKDGSVDGATFKQIEKDTADLSRFARAAKHAPPGVQDTPKGTDAQKVPVLLEETHALDDATKQQARAAITPGKSAGEVGAFQQTIAAGTYGPRMEKLLLETIDEQYKTAQSREHHHEHGNKLSMGQIQDAGNAAKTQVDAVFGSWATGAKMKADVNLVDRYDDDRARQKSESPNKQLGEARTRARYITNTADGFADLDKEHSADRSRPDEHEILTKVLDRVAPQREQQLLLIIATWGASTDPSGLIRIQRTSDGTEAGDRAKLWEKFGILIHEYLHSLTHPAFRKYRDDLAKTDPQGAHTLAEGVTELFARTVVSQVNFKDPTLRKQVLGHVPDDGEDVDIEGTYDSAVARAQTLVGVVGIHNLYAAYFLGDTKLIGA